MPDTKPSFDPNQHLIDIKGKQYLPVAYRIAWFRADHPKGHIDTELVERGQGFAVFKATINSETEPLSTSHGSETKEDWKDYLEKAETKAIGRALAAAGYGTQFAPELDEGNRIVDSPVQRPSSDSAGTNPDTGEVADPEGKISFYNDYQKKMYYQEPCSVPGCGKNVYAKYVSLSNHKYSRTLCYDHSQEADAGFLDDTSQQSMSLPEAT